MKARPPLEPIPGRKTPAKGVFISTGHPTIVLLTVTTKARGPWLANPKAHADLQSIWQAADAWLVGYYVLMPDHLHLFCAPRDLQYTIEKWVCYWKSQFTRAHLDERWDWQRGCFHHRLRDGREFEEKWTYVKENPTRKGFTDTPEDWPYQGIIHDLRW